MNDSTLKIFFFILIFSITMNFVLFQDLKYLKEDIRRFEKDLFQLKCKEIMDFHGRICAIEERNKK